MVIKLYTMMEYACKYEVCQEPVESMCLCMGGPVYLCARHKAPHRMTPSDSRHIMKDNKKYLNPERKSQISEYLSARLNSLKEQQRSVHLLLKKFLDMFDLTFHSLETQIYYLERKLTDLLISDNVALLTRIIKDQDEDILDLNDIIRDEEFILDKLSKNLRAKDIKDSIQSLFKKYWKNSYQNLYIFRPGTTVLIEINPNTPSQRDLPLNLDISQGTAASVCQLPNNHLFYSFGFANDVFIEKTLIINLKTRKVDVYPAPRGRKNAAAVLANNKVYVFGGCYKSELAYCDVFDLNTRKWGYLDKLPFNADNTSSLLIKDKILISGFNSKIFLYEYLTGIFINYSAINTNIQRNNLLVLDQDRIFLISRFVFVTNADLNDRWERKGDVLNFGSVISNPVTRGRLVFFICDDYQIYQFDLNSYSLYNIGSLS